jgi:hypothetical protein
MKKFAAILLIFIILITLSIPAYADGAKDSLKALLKVEAIAKDNPSGKDFLNAYADAKAETSLYLDSSEAKKNKKFASAIEKASNAYKWAATFWNMKLSNVPYVHQYDDFMKNFYKIYPESQKSLQGTIPLDRGILWCYSEASDNLVIARKLYK